MNNEKLKGMTLTEMLVVLAIIGVLILMSYPVYNRLIIDTRYKEAELNLKEIANFQQVYFFEHARYASALGDIHFLQQTLATEGGQAHFRFEIMEASHSDFRATATAVTDFDADGIMSVWEITKEGIPTMIVED